MDRLKPPRKAGGQPAATSGEAHSARPLKVHEFFHGGEKEKKKNHKEMISSSLGGIYEQCACGTWGHGPAVPLAVLG